MTSDPTGIKIAFDPTIQHMTGVTAHGYIPFRVPFITEIAPNLWQGGCKNGLILPKFIKHVVSLYPWESYKAKHEVTSTLTVRMHDAEDQDTGVVDELARWVTHCRKTSPVLVHCQAGLNRSSLVAARVLMLDGATADEAIRLIREKRSAACLCNEAFEEWLRSLPGAGEPAGQFTRVYTQYGKLAHLMRSGDRPPVGHPVALCRRHPERFGPWLGTGNQAERERAALLPTCARCGQRAKAAS